MAHKSVNMDVPPKALTPGKKFKQTDQTQDLLTGIILGLSSQLFRRV
jgi:hypothetical protein